MKLMFPKNPGIADLTLHIHEAAFKIWWIHLKVNKCGQLKMGGSPPQKTGV
jgi:hypothetical protein